MKRLGGLEVLIGHEDGVQRGFAHKHFLAFIILEYIVVLKSITRIDVLQILSMRHQRPSSPGKHIMGSDQEPTSENKRRT